MANNPLPIKKIETNARIGLWQGTQFVHAPASDLGILNADGGFTHSPLTSATQPIEHDGFAGLFNSAAAANNTHLVLTGTHTGPRFTQSFTVETEGENANGPGSSAYALWLQSQKTDYLTSTEPGEVDCLYLHANQGSEGDVGGMLIGVYKVDGGTGGITGIECVATRINSSSVAQLANDSVVGFLEGTGSISNGGGHGFYSEARTGTIYSGFTAMAGNDFSADLTHFFTGALERDTTTIKFQVSTDLAVGQRLFNSVTDTSNYEAGVLRWTSNVFQIGTDSPGTGTTREVALIRDGTAFLTSSSASVLIGAGLSLRFTNRGTISPNSDGVWSLLDNAGTSFGRLMFGGATASFPALKRSTTILQARLADDSDFAPLQGRLRVHANAAAETPTATHTMRVFDAAGTEYKVLCVAA